MNALLLLELQVAQPGHLLLNGGKALLLGIEYAFKLLRLLLSCQHALKDMISECY